MSIAAIIVASGNSQRMGFDKLSAPLAGKAVLLHSVSAFLSASSIDTLIMVCPPDRFEMVNECYTEKKVIRVDGGAHRQDSVLNGLSALPEDATIVAVHDGARPLITAVDIEKCITAAKQYGASTLARPLTETIKRVDADGFARSNVDRANLWFMETPQCFRTKVLLRAYENVRLRNLSVTDEVSAVESIGISTMIIRSEKPNIKITTPHDLMVVRKILEEHNEEDFRDLV